MTKKEWNASLIVPKRLSRDETTYATVAQTGGCRATKVPVANRSSAQTKRHGRQVVHTQQSTAYVRRRKSLNTIPSTCAHVLNVKTNTHWATPSSRNYDVIDTLTNHKRCHLRKCKHQQKLAQFLSPAHTVLSLHITVRQCECDCVITDVCLVKSLIS